VKIAPFEVWSLYSPHLLFSLLLSLAFPMTVSILYVEQWRGSVAFPLAWAVFAAAMIIFILFAEVGARFSHRNFFWGAFMALYLLFLTCADIWLRQPMSAKAMAVLAVFLLHLGSGLLLLLENCDRSWLQMIQETNGKFSRPVEI
jgi:hypothetical protein